MIKLQFHLLFSMLIKEVVTITNAMNTLSVLLNFFVGTFDNPLEKMIAIIYGEDSFAQAVNILLMSPETTLGGAWSTIKDIYQTVVLPIGYTLLILHFLLELMDKTTHDNFNVEHFLRMFIKLLIGNYLMTNGLSILESLMSFGTALVKDVSNISSLVTSGSAELETLRGKYLDKNILQQFGFLLELMIPFIVAIVVKVSIWMQCYSRLIEILVRAMLAPIAMADVYSEGIRGGGFRYLRKYIAVLLQGAIIIGILVCASALATEFALPPDPDASEATATIPNFLTQTAIQLTTLTLVGKSQNIANDLVGV